MGDEGDVGPPDVTRAFEVTTTVSSSVEEIAARYEAADVELRQVEAGDTPTSVTMATDDRLQVIAGEVGIPTVAWKSFRDDQITVALITEAPNGSRWSEVDLDAGTVLVYGPGSRHAATNRPGLRFITATADLDDVERQADLLEIDFVAPPAGSVEVIGPSAVAGLIDRTFQDFAASRPTADDVLRSLAHVTSADDELTMVGAGRGIDSTRVVHECIAYAEAVDRVPSVSELCRVAHVSERRLRAAFTDEFDEPPSRFFRQWALGVVHRRLLSADPHESSVTDIAVELGFDHLGRFAGQYRSVFGEAPSATLRSTVAADAG